MKKRLICLIALALCLPLLPFTAAAAQSQVSLRGIQLRHLAHRPTDKWYMAAPVGLSSEEPQVIDLIAGNRRVAGSLTARVTPDGLTVMIDYPQDATVLSQALWLYEDLTQLNLDTPAGEALAPGQAIPLSEAARTAGVVWLYLDAALDLPAGLENLPYFTAQGRREIAQRIQMADQHGLAEVYQERLGSGTTTPKTGIPDENGCIDGVCPVVLPLPAPGGSSGFTPFPGLP